MNSVCLRCKGGYVLWGFLAKQSVSELFASRAFKLLRVWFYW